jgi:5-formyltetrahydrofolate cyclo-ligase
MSFSKKDKKSLRQTYMARRQALSSWQVTAFSQQICQSLIEFITWDQIKVMHLYLPIIKRNEVDTHPLIIHTRTSHLDVLIAVPKVTPGEDFLNHYLLKESTQLVANKLGIPEPVAATPVPVTQIDLVLVPMLAFDKAGNRIGYGKGHYDRFLAQCRPDTQKIGLCFFGPVDKIEVESTDIAMNAVVTPESVRVF